ncbi:MAG: FG-GAP-like repeat-containing protein [Thermoanaerobaculia bacterium]
MTLTVTATEPPRNATNVASTSALTLHFDQALLPGSATSVNIRAYGKQSGPVAGTLTLMAGNHAVRLRPTRRFAPGETVLVNLSHGLKAADGSPLRAAGYAYQFSIAASGSAITFSDHGDISVRTAPGTGTRLYGAQASDLDLDGWLDLATMNEDAADLRVLMNEGGGLGTFAPFLQPTTPIGAGASPNEPGDFDNDGFPDAAVDNGSEGTVSIVLGNGDGTFSAEQVVDMDDGPHGIAALDVDGDADMDLVTANFIPGNLSQTLNDGAGHFATATALDSGSGWEWTLTSGDMDNDGITDLVVGVRTPNVIRILHGLGNGGFQFGSEKAAGGTPWMLVVGDVNGDGNLDVTDANGGSANGAILLGNGDGTLQNAVTHSIQGDAISTDLGDFDGDGDLDWIIASYGGARWDLYQNDGTGTFTFNQRFSADQAGSCALPFDFDNDGDLDLALFDELADVIQLKENTAARQLLFLDRFEQGDMTAWTLTEP